MATSRDAIVRPQGEEYVKRPIPEEKPGDETVDLGWVWDNETNQLLAVEGINPHPDDTFRVIVQVDPASKPLELILPPGGKERLRLDVPTRPVMRRALPTDPVWQRAVGWSTGVHSVTVERTFGKPVRNSPVILSAANTDFFGGATTTHNVPMPATVDPNDGLLVCFFHDNASLVQASGFSERATASQTDRAYVFAKVAVGDEDGTNVDFQALTASFATAHVYRIQAGTWAEVVSGIHVTSATGTTATPNPPNNVPLWGSDDNMWIAYAAKVSGTITAAPTNYTDLLRDSSNLTGSARRSLTASSEDPGTFGGSTSAATMAFTIAIASDDADFGDIPIFVGAGTTAAGTAGVTAALPGGIVTGDKLLLHIQGEGEDANADPANADWTLVDTQASATGGAAGDTRLTVYEVDYDSGDPPSLAIGDAGDHIVCFITAWRDPNGGTLEIEVVQGTTDSSGDTSLSATGVTTTTNNALIVVSVGLGDDSGVLAWVNASLAAPTITAAGGARTTSGSDGSVSVAFGGLATAGASGTTTGTLATSEEEANIVLALVPTAAGPNEGSSSGTVTWAGSAAGTTIRSGAATGAVTWTGTAAGHRTSSAAATGAVTWSGAATGISPHHGEATGSITWNGAATGHSLPQGNGAGSIAWTGAAAGTTTRSGASTGTVAWTGTAAGTTIREGASTGSTTWTGSATGTTVHEGDVEGAVTWDGAAAGEAPAEGVQEGSATGAVTWAGSAQSSVARSGGSPGNITWAGVVTGIAVMKGAATGSATWSGSAIGSRLSAASASGLVVWVGEATGVMITAPPLFDPHVIIVTSYGSVTVRSDVDQTYVHGEHDRVIVRGKL